MAKTESISSASSLTEGNLWKQILIFSLPLMISNILQAFFNMADIAVVGRFAGASALGSVGSTSTLLSLYTTSLIGIGNGINALSARFLGARQEKEAGFTIHTSFFIGLFSGILLLIVGELSSHYVLVLMNTKDELLDGAMLYLRIYFLGMPALGLYNFGNAVFSSDGDTRHPLIILSCAGVINIILNVFFVVSFNAGVAGVALASVISQYISAVVIIIALMKRKGICSLRLSQLKFSPFYASQILKIAIPAAIQNAIFMFANLFVQMGINKFDAVYVEGNTAAANADYLMWDVMAAFYAACSTYIAQNYGAGNKKRILKTYFIALTYSAGVAVVLGALLYTFGLQFLSVFTDSAEVAQAGLIRLHILAAINWISAFMDNTNAASRGLGKTGIPTLMVFLGSCVFRVIWIYTIFAWIGTLNSLYALYAASWSLTALAEIIYFAHTYRKLSPKLN